MQLCGTYSVISLVISETIVHTGGKKTAFNIKCSYILPANFVLNVLFAVNSAPCERQTGARSGSSKMIHSIRVLRRDELTAVSDSCFKTVNPSMQVLNARTAKLGFELWVISMLVTLKARSFFSNQGSS